ncbi:MAG TPA: hypothetical protein VHB02_03075 [Acidimicrobiales bacterium]|nr:hypothetical protein [Acidimicrobiales bacterium]
MTRRSIGGGKMGKTTNAWVAAAIAATTVLLAVGTVDIAGAVGAGGTGPTAAGGADAVASRATGTDCQAPTVTTTATATMVRTTTTPTVAPGTAPATLSTGTTTPVAFEPVCSWRVTYSASDPEPKGLLATTTTPSVTQVYLGTVHMTLGTQYTFSGNGTHGVHCNGKVKVLNAFGGGAAQGEIVSTFCNTDTHLAGNSRVRAVGTTFATTTIQYLHAFSTVYTSFVTGHTIFFGIFTFCSESPVGSHTHWDCVYFDGGPLF